MIAHASHTGFIVAAYAVAALVVASMVLSIAMEHRALRRDLRRCGARGLDRE